MVQETILTSFNIPEAAWKKTFVWKRAGEILNEQGDIVLPQSVQLLLHYGEIYYLDDNEQKNGYEFFIIRKWKSSQKAGRLKISIQLQKNLYGFSFSVKALATGDEDLLTTQIFSGAWIRESGQRGSTEVPFTILE